MLKTYNVIVMFNTSFDLRMDFSKLIYWILQLDYK